MQILTDPNDIAKVTTWLDLESTKAYIAEIEDMVGNKIQPVVALDDGSISLHRDLRIPFLRSQDIAFCIFCDHISLEYALPQYIDLIHNSQSTYHDFNPETPRDL